MKNSRKPNMVIRYRSSDCRKSMSRKKR